MTIARFSHVSEEQYLTSTGTNSLELGQIPLPKRVTAGSAGYDFCSTIDAVVKPGQSILIATGIRCEMEIGWVLMLFPRSSMGFKHNVRLSNTVGIIDSDYFHAKNEGHIMVKLYNAGDHDVIISKGERFCQGVFLPHGYAQETDQTIERTGGIGSTGQ